MILNEKTESFLTSMKMKQEYVIDQRPDERYVIMLSLLFIFVH